MACLRPQHFKWNRTRAPEKTKKYKIASDCAAASVVVDIHLCLGSLSCGVTPLLLGFRSEKTSRNMFTIQHTIFLLLFFLSATV